MHRHDLALKLRKRGFSYAEISARTGYSKGALSYKLRGIRLSPVQYVKLEAKKALGGIKGRKKIASVLASGSAKGRRWRRQYAELGKRYGGGTPSRKAWIRSGLIFLKDELKTKALLDAKFGVSFHKELIGGCFIDFASKRKLIEHTRAGSVGIMRVVRRFQKVANVGDTRKRYAYVDTQKMYPKARRLLRSLQVKIIDFRNLSP